MTPSPPPSTSSLTVRGHRLCISCGYVLTGQSIKREPHYNLLIVRCPECGVVAALQEQSALGKWAARWIAIAATLWIAWLALLTLGATSSLAGVSTAIGVEAASGFRQALWSEFMATLPAEHPAHGDPNAVYYTPEGNTWLATQNHALVLERAGGVWNTLPVSTPWLWVLLLLLAAAIGMLWAITLCHWRHRTLLIAGVILGLFTLGWAWLMLEPMRWDWPSQFIDFYRVSTRLATPPVTLAGVVIATGGLLVGLCWGRAWARLLVRFLLPPGAQVAMNVLWTTDGKTSPR